MKTSELLNLDCRKEENKKLLNRFLWKVKPCAKLLDKNNYTRAETAPIELLEQVLHGICCKYNYGFSGLTGIHPYCEDGKFIMYDATLTHKTYMMVNWKIVNGYVTYMVKHYGKWLQR